MGHLKKVAEKKKKKKKKVNVQVICNTCIVIRSCLITDFWIIRNMPIRSGLRA